MGSQKLGVQGHPQQAMELGMGTFHGATRSHQRASSALFIASSHFSQLPFPGRLPAALAGHGSPLSSPVSRPSTAPSTPSSCLCWVTGCYLSSRRGWGGVEWGRVEHRAKALPGIPGSPARRAAAESAASGSPDPRLPTTRTHKGCPGMRGRARSHPRPCAHTHNCTKTCTLLHPHQYTP